MSRGPDAATLLERALLKDAARAGCPVLRLTADWDRWASATFNGARHRLTLRAPRSAAIDRWIAALPEADLPLCGHLVADIEAVARRDHGGTIEFDLEALTVEG
jgi:hypothetical protein